MAHEVDPLTMHYQKGIKTGRDMMNAKIVPKKSAQSLALITLKRLEALKERALHKVTPEMLGSWVSATIEEETKEVKGIVNNPELVKQYAREGMQVRGTGICTAKTGAATAAAEVLPQLEGRMSGLSYRVPTTDGSIADISLVVTSKRDLDEKYINEIFRVFARGERYYGRLAIHEEKEIASADIVGRTENAIFVPSKTHVHSLGSGLYHMRIVCGYDNEMGPPKDQIVVTSYIGKKERQ